MLTNDRDSSLPALSVNQARILRVLVKSTMTKAGHEVTVHGDHFTDSSDFVYGLDSLSRKVKDLPVKDWPAVVESHATTLRATVQGPDEFDVPTEDLLERTYLRLYENASLPDVDWLSYGYEPFPGVTELLALDLPETVAMFNDDHVRRHGLETLREAGLRNLRKVVADDHAEIDGIHHLVGSVHLASTVLVLDEVVRRTTGEQDLPNGVLVAVPCRNRLMYHVPSDQDFPTSLNSMIPMAVTVHSSSVGPLSPHVFWWNDGEFHRLTFETDDGATVVYVGDEFTEVFNRLIPG
ncbi:hypothetical protein [Allokutzneria sp. NRRL B-24872]|uniref:hypothetical protein n=1 Tax=Allokutzneria sp. NRRL B-24872 TaxID=1137961 RepID=UPI000A37A3B6|nr:hypothetical protein [Allokutzneria sp. NRRL B-24872]